MEEAEALSTKIGIMVNGELKCLGSIGHIKTKFGQGYEIEIKIIKPRMEIIEKTIEEYKIRRENIFTIEEC